MHVRFATRYLVEMPYINHRLNLSQHLCQRRTDERQQVWNKACLSNEDVQQLLVDLHELRLVNSVDDGKKGYSTYGCE